MSDDQRADAGRLSARSREPKAPGNRTGRGGNSRPPQVNQIVELVFAALTVFFLCYGGLRCLNGSSSPILTNFVPFLVSISSYFLIRAWPSIDLDQGTLVGLGLIVTGAYFIFRATQDDHPEQKSIEVDIGLGLISCGLGIFLGRQIPPSTHSNDE